MAGLVNRVINERIKAGKKGPLGFLNPTLYQHPEIFNDITVGDQRFGGPKATGHDNQPSACGNKGRFNPRNKIHLFGFSLMLD